MTLYEDEKLVDMKQLERHMEFLKTRNSGQVIEYDYQSEGERFKKVLETVAENEALRSKGTNRDVNENSSLIVVSKKGQRWYNKLFVCCWVANEAINPPAH